MTGINPVLLGFAVLAGFWALVCAARLIAAMLAAARLQRRFDAVEGQRDAGPAVFVPFHASEVGRDR